MNARFISVGVLASLLALSLLGGCVSSQKYKEALAANNRAQALLDQARGQAEAANEARRQLEMDLAAQKATADQKDQLIARQQQALAAADKRFKDLQARYKADTADLGPAPYGALVALPPELDTALREWAEAYPNLVEYDPARGMVKFKTDLMFAAGSDDVQAEAKATLVKLAEIIKTAKPGKFHVYVAGHTDDMPIGKPETKRRHPTNWYLSVHRAVAVKDVLAAAGVDEKTLGVMGFGEFHPVAANAPNKRGNPLNRRVEIWIVPPERFLTAPAAEVEAPAEGKDQPAT